MPKPLPLTLQLVQGAIGKEFVIKHYHYGRVKTRYPDMSRIVASVHQRKCRDLFKEAVVFAKTVIADKPRKEAWQKKLRRRNGVYNEAIKYFMLKDKRAKEAAILLANSLIRRALGYRKPAGRFSSAALNCEASKEGKNSEKNAPDSLPLPDVVARPSPRRR